MKHVLCIFLLMVSSYGFSCTCREGTDTQELLGAAQQVFLGEIVNVEPIGKLVAPGEAQLYQLTIKIIDTYKGKTKPSYRFEGVMTYNEPNSDVITVSTCNFQFETGLRVLVFLENLKKIKFDSWCMDGAFMEEHPKFEYFFNEIQKTLNKVI